MLDKIPVALPTDKVLTDNPANNGVADTSNGCEVFKILFIYDKLVPVRKVPKTPALAHKIPVKLLIVKPANCGAALIPIGWQVSRTLPTNDKLALTFKSPTDPLIADNTPV